MDPQKLSQLDPKLREAYQRVMGTTIPEPQAPPVQTQAPPPVGEFTAPATDSIPTPQVQQPVMPTGSDNFPTPEPQVTPPSSGFINAPQPVPTPNPAIQTNPASNFVQMNSEVTAPAFNSPNFSAPAPQVATFKKKNGLTPVLFGILGLIFIVIYTFFWTKIFNFKLPFLP